MPPKARVPGRPPPSSCDHHTHTYTAAMPDDAHGREHELLAERAGRPTVPRDRARVRPVLIAREKNEVIRQLNYDASTKILFQVRRRFWEEEDGIFGGPTVTDLAVRRLAYPTPDPSTERGL